VDHSALARNGAMARIGVGAAFLLLPAAATRPLVGPDAERPAAKMLARGLGIRDVILGVGLLRATARKESLRAWQVGASVADGADALAMLVAFRQLRRFGRSAAIAAAATSAVLGGYASTRLE